MSPTSVIPLGYVKSLLEVTKCREAGIRVVLAVDAGRDTVAQALSRSTPGQCRVVPPVT